MDRQASRTDDRRGQLPTSGSRRLRFSSGRLFAALLLLTSTTYTAEPKPNSIDVFQRPAMQSDFSGLEQLILTGQYSQAERAIRQRLKRLASIAEYHYLLAVVLAAVGHSDDALKSLETAVHLGFSGDLRPFAEQFGTIAERPSFAKLAAQIDALRDKKRDSSHEPNPAKVQKQTAIVGRSNTIWDPDEKVLKVAFRFDDAGPRKGIVPVGPTGSGKAPLLNRLYLAGRAAGNHGDLYDNRDRGHSTLTRAALPQLTFVEYGEGAQKARIDYGFNPGLQFNAITVGNSSSAVTGGPFWRSQPRLELTNRGGPERLFRQYSGNHLYIYPEHRDHDVGQGDLFPANTPYVLISQGSSGSDQALMRAAVFILAAFKPDVKDFLKQNNLVMPTLQMVFRRSLKTVSSDADYLSGIAHPSVFRANNIDLTAMVERASALDVSAIPPMVKLAAMNETEALPGIHIFGGGNMRLFDTPSAIARIVRSTTHRHRMRVSADQTKDPSGRNLNFHWVVLRGDKDRIRIKQLDERASVVDLDIPWHDSRLVPGSDKLESNRVDIGVFAFNGVNYSAPAFVSFYYPANQLREYDADGRVRLVDYDRSALRNRYADPMLFPLRDWSDEYHYDDVGRMTGWTRNRDKGSTQFTRHGARVIEADKLGRPLRAAVVRYALKRGPGNVVRVVESPSGHVLRYAYQSEADYYGRLAAADQLE